MHFIIENIGGEKTGSSPVHPAISESARSRPERAFSFCKAAVAALGGFPRVHVLCGSACGQVDGQPLGAGHGHDLRGSAAHAEEGGHRAHRRIDVREEFLVAGAEIIQPRFAARGAQKAVLGALAVTGESHRALATVARQHRRFGRAEGFLLRRVDHPGERGVEQVAQLVARVNVVIATEDVTIVFDRERAAAIFGEHANSGRLTRPVGEGGIELLHEDSTDVALHPLVEDRREKFSVVGRAHAPLRHLGFEGVGVIVIGWRSEPQTAGFGGFDGGVAFDNRDELDVAGADGA